MAEAKRTVVQDHTHDAPVIDHGDVVAFVRQPRLHGRALADRRALACAGALPEAIGFRRAAVIRAIESGLKVMRQPGNPPSRRYSLGRCALLDDSREQPVCDWERCAIPATISLGQTRKYAP